MIISTDTTSSSRRPGRDYQPLPGRQATALWFPARGVAALLEEELPERAEGECLIQTEYSAISPGTERIVFSGHVPPVLYQEMRCPYMSGEFSFPVKYGYSLVGRVLEGPTGLIGQRVHVLHPHQDRVVVHCADLFPVPEPVPPWRATLLSNMETAINAIWDSDVRIGDSALVIGFGIIGSLVARILSWLPGVRLEVSDRQEQKLELASRLGFRARRPEHISDGFDLVFHTSGAPDGLQSAIDHLAFEGKVIELSWYGTQSVLLQLGESFHSQRKAIISSQVSTVPASRRPHWNLARRKRLALDLLTDPRWDEHLSRTVHFADLPAFFTELAAAPSAFLSVVVAYNGSE